MMLMFDRAIYNSGTSVVQQSGMCCSCVHTHQTLDGLLDDVCCHNVV